ncbi:hypothetical protein Tco_0449356 [Tanacetum coccineum]
MNNSVTIAYRFEITLQLCLFDGSKPKNNDELQPRLSNFFKNFESNGGDDLCYQGGLDKAFITKNTPSKGSKRNGKFVYTAISKAGTKLLLHRAHFSCSWDKLGISTLKTSAADTGTS